MVADGGCSDTKETHGTPLSKDPVTSELQWVLAYTQHRRGSGCGQKVDRHITHPIYKSLVSLQLFTGKLAKPPIF